MKLIFFPAIFGALFLLMGCSDDNSLFNEPMPIRAYETDAQIMAQFVEVNKASGTYVLNPYSNTVIDGDDDDSFCISKLAEDEYTRGNSATVKLENDRGNSASFYSGIEMVMNVSAPTLSTFYLAQVTLTDQTDENTETVIISGVRSMLPNHSYHIVTSPLLDGLKKISGINLIGDGNATISISQ